MTLPGYHRRGGRELARIRLRRHLRRRPGRAASWPRPSASPFPLLRCCRRAPLLGNRFVCIQRRQRPGETCVCTETLTGPLILCKDNVLTF